MKTVNLADLLHLSVPERIQLAEDLWDSVAAEAAIDPDRLPVSEAQRREVLRRSALRRDDPEEAFPLEEALDRVDQSLG